MKDPDSEWWCACAHTEDDHAHHVEWDTHDQMRETYPCMVTDCPCDDFTTEG